MTPEFPFPAIYDDIILRLAACAPLRPRACVLVGASPTAPDTTAVDLFEVSTPQLDDVIRLSDDYGRHNRA